MSDLSHVQPRHKEVDIELENWARWVRVTPRVWFIQPMFKQYRAPRQYEHQAELPPVVRTLDAQAVEKLISQLPDKHRIALRWAYVWPWVPVSAVRQELGMTRAALIALIDDGRDMMCNKMRRGCNSYAIGA